MFIPVICGLLRAAFLKNTPMRKYCVLLWLLASASVAHGQEHADYLLWSPTHKLSVADFGIKNHGTNDHLSFAQFSIDYSVNGFDFLSRKFNKKVKNAMITSASWIDTTRMVAISLRYQQTLFDLAEIYARQFRKRLRENRKQIAKGTDIVRQWSEENATALSKRRLQYDTETKSGTDEARQKEWETTIQKELTQLDAYAYGK